MRPLNLSRRAIVPALAAAALLAAGAAAATAAAPAAVRLATTSVSPPDGAADLALGRPAQASSARSARLGAAKAVDPWSRTSWTARRRPGQWLQVDLGRRRTVAAVSLNWGTAFAKRYLLSRSLNGTRFARIGVVTIGKAGWQTTRFRAVPAKVVRVTALKRATRQGVTLRDVRVLGPAAAAGGGGATPSAAAAAAAARAAAAAAAAAAAKAPPPAPAAPAAAVRPSVPSVVSTRQGVALGGGFDQQSDADITRSMNDMQAMGVRWVRVLISWDAVQQPGPTTFRWTAHDKVIQAARARGINVLGELTYTPPWARPPGGDAQTPPANPQDYANFAAAAVRRYAPQGVHAWEIWNEPNHQPFFHPKPDVAVYTTLLKAAYTAITAADPTAVVVTGGTSPAPTNGTDYSPVDWLKGIYANGGKNYFDAVGHHPYNFPDGGALSTQPWSAWYQMFGTPESLRSVMTANGDAAKTIWMTEYGAPTGGQPANKVVSEATQAQFVTDAYRLAKSYPWAGPLFWYQYRDHGTSTDTIENFMGLVRYDFSHKPSAEAYLAAAATG